MGKIYEDVSQKTKLLTCKKKNCLISLITKKYKLSKSILFSSIDLENIKKT